MLSKTNLYIRGLPANTTDQDLKELCKKYGKITSTKAILDKTTNQCKGYGFVDFELPEQAEHAVKCLQAEGIQAQMAKQQEQDPTNLYIANLPLTFTEQHLEEMLQHYGTVISTRILRDTTNNVSRGVGFARMEKQETCEKIINDFNNKLLPGCSEPLLVKLADGAGNKKKNQQYGDGRAGEDMVIGYDPAATAAAIAQQNFASLYTLNGLYGAHLSSGGVPNAAAAATLNAATMMAAGQGIIPASPRAYATAVNAAYPSAAQLNTAAWMQPQALQYITTPPQGATLQPAHHMIPTSTGTSAYGGFPPSVTSQLGGWTNAAAAAAAAGATTASAANGQGAYFY